MILFRFEIEEKVPGEVLVTASYGDRPQTVATALEGAYAHRLRALFTAAICTLEPVESGKGKTTEEAITRLNIGRDIREAGE